ncbi:unnamed protein product, partial [Prorocentrum cordatum]
PSGLQGFVLRAKTPRGEQAPRPRTRAPRDGETTMAASSRAASIALFALALLCQPCATADADCKAEEREDEAALLQAESAARRSAARRSSAAGAGGHAQAANSTSGAVSDAASQKCGVIYIADSWTCCKDAHGNGIGAAPGSICCRSPVTGGVLACGAGSVCNPSSELDVLQGRPWQRDRRRPGQHLLPVPGHWGRPRLRGGQRVQPELGPLLRPWLVALWSRRLRSRHRVYGSEHWHLRRAGHGGHGGPDRQCRLGG